MIRIHRPSNAPAILLTEGVARRRAHEIEVGADLGSFVSGAATLTFDRTVYADSSVKTELIAMQHGKCAFCEAKPLPVSDGDVEHFRPKAAVRQSDVDPLQRPGYYWLAYAWENLLFACERCNRRHKKSLFPLIEPSRRATSHRATIDQEAPVFVDPSAEDPEQYITYREHVPVAVNDNPRGKQTIEALGLQRRELNADRDEHLQIVKHLHTIVSHAGLPDDVKNGSRAVLMKQLSREAKYSLMSRIAVQALGGIV